MRRPRVRANNPAPKILPKPNRSPRRIPRVILPSLAATPAPKSAAITGAPITPDEALRTFSDIMTDRERAEIRDFREIFYIRQSKPSPQAHMVHEPDFFPFILNDHIRYRYQQLAELGKGAFGTVIKCFDHKTKQQVAVKIVRELPGIMGQINQEREVSRLLISRDAASHHIVKVYDVLRYRSFFLLITEVLSVNLYVSMKASKFAPMEMSRLQMVMRQIADAVSFIHSLGLIHCDLKPENVLWTCPRRTGVKLIDFGCCCYAGRTMFTYVQSRFYRAPEVMLGMDYGCEIDVWSFACVAYELATGKVLFPGRNEMEQMALLISVLGMPPEHMIRRASRRERFFDKDGRPLAVPTLNVSTHPGSRPLSSLLDTDDALFMSLIQQCLAWEPSKRPKAAQIVRHPWMASRCGYR